MCGVVGVFGTGDEPTLTRMTDLIAHRGPDDDGIWSDRFGQAGFVGLGNRRLSIIDLSAAGKMPMANADQTLWITYNGEIYNYQDLRRELLGRGVRFTSDTDTEVILRLFELEGPDMVTRLNGMFAFGIVDLRGEKPSLFLARDHFGIKPLYLWQQGRALAFASELKSLLQLPAVSTEIDPRSLHEFLTFLWVPEPKTMIDGIEKLPAGHYATFTDGRLDIKQYWDLPLTSPSGDEVDDGLIDALRERFAAAVKRQMVADVPIGAYLSSGLDSSSIVGMMARHSSEPVSTYTITFPTEVLRGENTLDDPEVARRFAASLGCDHHHMVVDPGVANMLPKLVWHMDEPVADPAIIAAYLVSESASSSVKVLLSGVGGDELFAGYRKHYGHYWADAYKKLPRRLRGSVIEPALAAIPSHRGSRFKGMARLARKMGRAASLDARAAFLMHSTYLDTQQKSALYTPALRDELAEVDPWRRHQAVFDDASGADFLEQMLYVDMKTFMPSLNLNYGDKMSMAASVEARVPFLDIELVEFVARNVPTAAKIKGFWRPTTKWILREAMRGIVPDEVLTQPKAGFGAPIDHWLAVDLAPMVDELLSPDRIRKRGLLEPSSVRRLVTEHRDGTTDWSMQIWQLMTLELWCETFLESPAPVGAVHLKG